MRLWDPICGDAHAKRRHIYASQAAISAGREHGVGEGRALLVFTRVTLEIMQIFLEGEIIRRPTALPPTAQVG
jgi:hypothetical protein